MTDRLLLDTSFIQALLNSKDRYHQRAKKPNAIGAMTIIITWSRVSLRNVAAVGGSLSTSVTMNRKF